MFHFTGQVGRSAQIPVTPAVPRLPARGRIPTARFRFGAPPGVSTGGMDLKKPLVLLALAGSLVACGDNTNLDRGETNCDAQGQEASNEQDESCEEEGPEDD